MIWNGLKSNINISSNWVSNNNCCGIELQDGDASGVTISGNYVDIGSGDNALGLTGLNSSVGANLINNNTIIGGGRFGIEIKNPAGGVTVSNNSVSLTTINGETRDRAGIAVMRRGVLGANADVPNGVTVTGNTVDGYTQASGDEGFGIVIEGTNHTVSGNTVTNCEVGIQQQGGAHPNSGYPGDGNQSAGMSANYFGRGNSPIVCGNTISGNTFSGNGTDTRNVIGTGNYGLVVNTNTNENFYSIQAAVNDAQTLNGHTITVNPANPGTQYDEQVVVNKELTIKSATPTQAVVNFTGTASGKPSLFDVTANNVTIENLNMNVDLSKLRSAIIASSAGLDAITVKDNTIGAYGTPAGSYGDRNAVSVNYGGTTNYRVATGGVNSVTFTGNTVSGTGPGSYFRSGIALDEGGLTTTGNTLTTINHDVLLRFAGNGANNINNNTLNGGGIELSIKMRVPERLRYLVIRLPQQAHLEQRCYE
ncbi:MAG: right-handed parallel beta-helix repeat-containing protein [Bacteroidota bacterium]|nr:MAG: right-handed parallel beta-helix repeat-containing protein [Bacteroidota bacterium]